ncbi:Uncharacterised protein [Bordetella pertussis]|nr:Uncharacterised protein [Bordetella pertussis]
MPSSQAAYDTSSWPRKACSGASSCRRRISAPASLGLAKGTEHSNSSPSAASSRKRKLPSSSRKLTKRASLAALRAGWAALAAAGCKTPRPTASRSVRTSGCASLRALAAPTCRMSSIRPGLEISST